MTRLTIELDETLDASLTRMAEEAGCSKGEVVRQMLRHQSAIKELRETNAMLRPLAEGAGYRSDEDFFRDFS